EYNKIKKIDDLLSLDVKVITNYIIDFLLNMKKRKLKSSTRRVRLAALRHFTTMNDIILNWKKIYKINREAERPKKNCIKEYSYDDIKKMLSVSDLCDQTMIYLMSSSGVRIGAIPELKYGDLTKIEIADKVSRVDDSSDNEYIYMVKAYAGYSEEYLTFTTAETARAIDGYRQYRERFGEKIKV